MEKSSFVCLENLDSTSGRDTITGGVSAGLVLMVTLRPKVAALVYGKGSPQVSLLLQILPSEVAFECFLTTDSPSST